MSNTDTGGPAFPSPYDDDEGMTLRDYFAAKAMQGLLASTTISNGMVIAKDAYLLADAMLKARAA